MAKQGDYAVDERKTIAEAPGLRIRQLALGPGQCVPWHRHTEITDTFFCMAGPMVVETADPRGVHELQAGETFAAAAGQPHYVHGRDMGACRFMIVQGVGTYDYVAVEPPKDA